jgi:CRP/FNR family transcriptional regulator, cyclic AMP receptor protein
MTIPSTKETVEILSTVPLFSGTDRKRLRDIAELCEIRAVRPGKVLTEQGAPGRQFFVVLSGTARCEVDGREIREFAPGSFFGELALLAGGPRSATIVAETAMELLVLDRRDLAILLRGAPDVALKMLGSIAARLQEADHHVTH